MIKNLWQVVLDMFKRPTETTIEEVKKNDKFAEMYKDIDEINFTAIFSNKIANYVVNDSTVEVLGSKRAEYLNSVVEGLWKQIKKPTDMALGVGAVAIVPYTMFDRVYFKTVEQNRLSINEMHGDLITKATIQAEVKKVQNGSRTDTFIRWTDYEVVNNTLTIRERFTDGDGKLIMQPDFWGHIRDEVKVHGVDRVPFGFIKCPKNNRSTNDKFGVPITFGAENTIKEIKDTLKQIVREFETKQVFVGADVKMFRDGKLPKSGLYKKFNAENKDGSPFWEIFDPSIRESSYFARLEELYTRLEKEVGTSSGILTETKSSNATATEIKASKYDTFTIVDDMRSNIENGIYNLLKAVDVIANINKLAPMGEWELNFNWDYGLIESREGQFNELVIGVDKGVIAPEELRAFIKPTETLEEALERVEAINEKNPSIDSLLGE